MKKILYLTFYFEPDLCAGSFRNTPLVKELAEQLINVASIDVITTLPNRYNTYSKEAPEFEKIDNYTIQRINIPAHKSGMLDQVSSFKTYYQETRKRVRSKKYDLVVASSSRLFTAYLGYSIAKKLAVPLYLDIRDLFYDNMKEILHRGILKSAVLPFIKIIERKTFNNATHINLNSKGFKKHFEKYRNPNYSFYPNGIDDIFIQAGKEPLIQTSSLIQTIVYAGNIGEGQGLHKIIPSSAKLLENEFKFIIIGDGGAKEELVQEIKEKKVSNVELRDPIPRQDLLEIYKKADYLFVHLNDYEAFKKVLPSKLFELASFNVPVIAGVSGYAAEFVDENIENTILFPPCDTKEFVEKLRTTPYKRLRREKFINQFKRENITKELAQSIINYL